MQVVGDDIFVTTQCGSSFPALYYLTCPTANAAVSRLEASGVMRDMTARPADEVLRRRHESAHRDYLAGREAAARSAGIEPMLAGTSVGRRKPERVECLHALVAQELAAGDVKPFGCDALNAVTNGAYRGRAYPSVLMTRRVAAVGYGTNSLRLLVADVDLACAEMTDVSRRIEIVRLGQG